MTERDVPGGDPRILAGPAYALFQSDGEDLDIDAQASGNDGVSCLVVGGHSAKFPETAGEEHVAGEQDHGSHQDASQRAEPPGVEEADR